MAHQTGHYFYHTYRQGKRVIREYLGRGELGEALATLEAVEQEERQEEREAFRAKREREAEIDRAIDQAGALLRELVGAMLKANGYHRHKGQWRQRRHKEMGGELVKAQTEEMLQLRCEFRDLLEAADRSDANPESIEELKSFLKKHLQVRPLFLQMWPELDLAHHAAFRMISETNSTEAVRICLEGNFEALQYELAHPEDGPMEQMLIRHAGLCWLRLQTVEQLYTGMTSGSITVEKADFWERKLSATQRRYLRACETLVRVRRLKLPLVQVNVGNQQLNQINIKQ